MRLATAITCVATVALSFSVFAQPAAPTPPKRVVELFTGKGGVPWLPMTDVLPTAADIEAKAKTMGSRQRNMDPFALPTFPKEESLLPPTTDVARSSERITLNQALQNLKITGINLQKKEILMRGQNIFEGDVMMMSFRNEIFLAQVTEVSATQILFRDVKRQESGVLPHTLVPHLELEPIQNRTGRGELDGRVTPMEPHEP